MNAIIKQDLSEYQINNSDIACILRQMHAYNDFYQNKELSYKDKISRLVICLRTNIVLDKKLKEISSYMKFPLHPVFNLSQYKNINMVLLDQYRIIKDV